MSHDKRPYAYSPIKPVVLDAATIQAAAREANAEDAVAQMAAKTFELANGIVYEAQASVERGDQQKARLEEELTTLRKLLRETDRFWTRITAERETTLPLFRRISSYCLIAIAGVAFFMGNQVGVGYLTRSGLDIFATDIQGAALFMGAALLGSAALKAIDAVIANDVRKKLYFRINSGIGIACLLVWAVSLALVFTPDTGGTLSMLTNNASNTRAIAIALLFGHISADIFLGYTTLATAENVLLSGRKRAVIDNPAYAYLKDQIALLEEAIRGVDVVHAAALDYLRGYEVGRQLAEDTARIACRSERRRIEAARAAAIANAEFNSFK